MPIKLKYTLDVPPTIKAIALLDGLKQKFYSFNQVEFLQLQENRNN